MVLVQEIFGVGDYIQARGRDLAALGYVVCAPEIYWRLDDREMDETPDDVLPQAMAVCPAGRLAGRGARHAGRRSATSEA